MFGIQDVFCLQWLRKWRALLDDLFALFQNDR